ncbi:hypothetical protein COOONC_24924 [Cooperia oncophora]
MQSIYETFVEDDGSDDGNVVRGIDPGLGKLDGHEVLIFDISGINKEQANEQNHSWVGQETYDKNMCTN